MSRTEDTVIKGSSREEKGIEGKQKISHLGDDTVPLSTGITIGLSS